MKPFSLFLSLLVLYCSSYGQQSLPADVKNITLSISTPQPRLGEQFSVSLAFEDLRAEIFKPLAGKVRVVHDMYQADDGLLVTQVTAREKGRQEIGPLRFKLNQTQYVTNKVVYEVVNALPDTDEGIWIRKVKVDDTTYCLIMEQRIPAVVRREQNGNKVTIGALPQPGDLAKLKTVPENAGFNTPRSRTTSSFGSIKIDGILKQFMYGYAIYYFILPKPGTTLEIKEEYFEKLPAYYRFRNIVIP